MKSLKKSTGYRGLAGRNVQMKWMIHIPTTGQYLEYNINLDNTIFNSLGQPPGSHSPTLFSLIN